MFIAIFAAKVILLAFAADFAQAACTLPNGDAGQFQFIAPEMKYCNGTSWKSMSVSALGTTCSTSGTIQTLASDITFCNGTNQVSMKGPVATSCSGTTTGTISYSTARSQMEWCDGTDWRRLGPVAAGTIAVNLGGSSVMADGYSFVTSATAGLTVTNGTAFTQAFDDPITPSPSAGVKTLLESVIYRSTTTVGQSFTLSKAVSNGAYRVTAYCFENFQTNFRSEKIQIEGATFATGVCRLTYANLEKLGPYTVTVADGSIDVVVSLAAGNDPSLSAVVIEPAN